MKYYEIIFRHIDTRELFKKYSFCYYSQEGENTGMKEFDTKCYIKSSIENKINYFKWIQHGDNIIRFSGNHDYSNTEENFIRNVLFCTGEDLENCVNKDINKFENKYFICEIKEIIPQKEKEEE